MPWCSLRPLIRPQNVHCFVNINVHFDVNIHIDMNRVVFYVDVSLNVHMYIKNDVDVHNNVNMRFLSMF